VSEPLTGPAGFYGKLPARGDFVRFGLPRGFVDAWDGWLQEVLAASHAALGEEWLPAWLEAPVWRFALAPGLAGGDAVIGLWMPSVDQVGRYFPLTLAAVFPGTPPAVSLQGAGGFLDAFERAGRETLAADLTPEELAKRVVAALGEPAAEAGGGETQFPSTQFPSTQFPSTQFPSTQFPSTGALWWTAGAPRRPGCAFATADLPSAAAFPAMLDARQEAPV
jgi:type VI secretion system protein ImpM